MFGRVGWSVNMPKAQIYIEKHLKTRTHYTEMGGGGGVSSLNWGGVSSFNWGGGVVFQFGGGL